MTDFAQLEEIDGVRMTWNIWPNSKLEATKCVIPFATLYTPNRKLPNMPVRGLDIGKQCAAELWLFAQAWSCPFAGAGVALRAHPLQAVHGHPEPLREGGLLLQSASEHGRGRMSDLQLRTEARKGSLLSSRGVRGWLGKGCGALVVQAGNLQGAG